MRTSTLDGEPFMLESKHDLSKVIKMGSVSIKISFKCFHPTTTSFTRSVTLSKSNVADLKILVGALDASFKITKEVTIGGLTVHVGDMLMRTSTLDGEPFMLESKHDLSKVIKMGSFSIKISFKCFH